MRAFRNTGLLICLLLFVGSRLFTGSDNTVYLNVPVPESASPVLPENTSGIQSPVAHYFLAIETTVFSQTISEVHRLVSVSMLANRIIPLNYDFRRMVLIPVLINFCSPVPIFIKGHSLLH